MSLPRIIELPLTFGQLTDVKRFFILGTDRLAHDLHILLAGRFQNRFFGFFSNETEQGCETTDPVTAFYVRPLKYYAHMLGQGDYLFLGERNLALERQLHDQGVRLGFPRSLVDCFSTYEAPVFDIFLRDHFDLGTPQGVALDIGANFGMTAAMMSPYFSEVHAFEPNLTIFENMLRSNSLPANIYAHCLAFGSSIGKCEFFDMNGVNGSLVSITGCNSYPVSVDTVDNYCQMNDIVPRLIKIDAEKMDYEILLNAKDTIEAYCPFIFFENPASLEVAANVENSRKNLECLYDYLAQYYTLKAYPCLNQLMPHECIGMNFEDYQRLHQAPPLNMAAIPK